MKCRASLTAVSLVGLMLGPARPLAQPSKAPDTKRDSLSSSPDERPKSGALVVFATDSSSNSPLLWVQVKATPWYYTARNAPVHFAYPDSTGGARFESLPVNSYDVELCDELHARKVVEATITPGATDTIRVALKYLGPGRERRCEVRFVPKKDSLKR